MEEVVVRLATEDDVPGIRRAIRSSIEGLASKDYTPDIIASWGVDSEKSRDKQKAAIREKKELTFVALIDETIVGFSAISPETSELRAVYVAAEAAMLGVGTKLLLAVEQEAIRLGLSMLSMSSSLTAVPFYERHGYKNLGEKIHTLGTGVKMKAVEMKKSFT